MAAPLLVLDGLAAWLAHDNEHEAGLQLLQHVSRLVSVGGDGNVEWLTPATLAQRKWLAGVSVLPTARALHLSAAMPRQTHVRIAFSLVNVPLLQFWLKLDFERSQPKSSLVVMYRRSNQEQLMPVLLTSDADELHLLKSVSVSFDPQTSMYRLPHTPTEPSNSTTTTSTALEQIGILDARAFLNGVCMLASFIFAPAAQQLQRQIEEMTQY